MGRMKRIRDAVVGLMALAMVTAACTGASRNSPAGLTQVLSRLAQSPSPTDGHTGDATLLPSSPTALPSFTPVQFQQLLSQLRGKPVVVNIWASWCGPCIAEAPDLARIARQFEGRVQFIGVDILDDRSRARNFVATYGLPFPSVFDASGAIRDALGYIGQPVTIVLNAAGARVQVWSGDSWKA
jgi:thiol-disulfide isomerase/thioredoxin